MKPKHPAGPPMRSRPNVDPMGYSDDRLTCFLHSSELRRGAEDGANLRN